MRESLIEKKVSDYAKLLGWLTYKFTSPSCRGVCDRIYFKSGITILIEFKQLGKKPTKLQLQHINKLKNELIPVYVVDSVEQGKDIFNDY
jgi:hypothetical protein